MTRFLKNEATWRSIIAGFFLILTGIGGWGLVKVAAMPETYITKKAAQIQKEELSKQICDLKKDISDDINKMAVGIHGRLGNMEDRLNKKVEKTDNNLEKLQDLVIEHMVNNNENTRSDN